jgi:hypothetical protein
MWTEFGLFPALNADKRLLLRISRCKLLFAKLILGVKRVVEGKVEAGDH